MYSGFGNGKEKRGAVPFNSPPPPYVKGPTSVIRDSKLTATAVMQQELSNFCDYTSIHGLPHVKRVGHGIAKALWTLLTLGFLGVLLYEISDIAIRFARHDFNVLVEIKFDRKINFPAITVCNMNAYRKSQVEAYAGLYEDFRQAFEGVNVSDLARRRRKRSARKMRLRRRDTRCPHCARLRREAGSGSEGSGSNTTGSGSNSTGSGSGSGSGEDYDWDYDYMEERFWEQYYSNMDFMDEDDDLESMMYMHDVVNEMDYSVRSKLSHVMTTMLLNCHFQGIPCVPGNFTQAWSYHYGNCYTFNSWTSSNSTSQNLKSSKSGPTQGLYLELYAEMDEYLADMTNEVGFRVVVHDQHRIPFPHEDGFSIPTGFHSSVGVKRFQVERLGSPYSECASVNTADERNIYGHLVPSSYTLTVCEVSCYQHNLVKSCGCADAEYPMNSPSLPNNTVSCSMVNSTTALDCEEEIWEKYTEGKLNCDCPQVCKEVKYISSISQSVWPLPSEDYMAYYIRQLRRRGQPSINRWLGRLDDNLHTTTTYATEIRNNVALLEVYFEDLNYERIYQTSAYTLTQLISDIGGQLGLWLGLSVLSLSEFFELLLRLLVTCFWTAPSKAKVAVVKEAPPSKRQQGAFSVQQSEDKLERTTTMASGLQFT